MCQHSIIGHPFEYSTILATASLNTFRYILEHVAVVLNAVSNLWDVLYLWASFGYVCWSELVRRV